MFSQTTKQNKNTSKEKKEKAQQKTETTTLKHTIAD